MRELILKGDLAPDIADRIVNLEESIKALKEAEDNLKAELLAEMEKRNIIKLETESLAIRYVAECDVETFDKTAFKRENPDLYDEYITMKPRSAYITIKIKEN